MKRLTVAKIKRLTERGKPVTGVLLPVSPEWLSILWDGKIMEIDAKGRLRPERRKRK